MSHRALGEQFHVTTADAAEKVRSEGFKIGQPGGYGQEVHNYGPAVYTSSEHASETWASNMIGWNENVSLKKLPVEVDPSARVHTYDAHPDWHPLRRPVTMAEHLARHPDVAAHYTPPAPPHWSDKPMPDDEHVALTAAARKAGYHGVQLVPSHGADQTVWFDPSKLRAT